MKASILVCVYDKLAYTRRCLEILLTERSPLLHEIVVVDNGSTDGTAGYLAELAAREPLVEVLSPGENLGFVGGSNMAAAAATGELLVFLNNDTEPQPGWLEALVATIEADDSVGAVGARLVYPNGRLQEAGGIVWSDASGWNYGRGDDPARPAYTFVREVDYCSGACLLVRRADFERLGGFDERYAPAYYEDTDLCFALRAAGLRVLYQPAAVVVHHEGVTAGTDTSAGVKAYQVRNQQRFRDKWATALARHLPPHPSLVRRASRRTSGARILLVDPLMPMYDRASGSRRLYELLCLLARGGHAVTFVARNASAGDRYRGELEALGVEVYAGDTDRLPQEGLESIQLERLVAETGFDLAILSFYYIAEQYVPLLREHSPRTRILFDTVDLHHVREWREAQLTGDETARQRALETREREVLAMRSADATVVVTESDRAILLAEAPEARVVVIPNIHDLPDEGPVAGGRAGLVFVGNFSHPPNVDAMLFFCSDVLPLVREHLPEVTVDVVGAEPPLQIRELAGNGISVTGWVPDVEPYLSRARLSIAPLRFGSGMKGKVGEALAHGLPVVTTSVGAEGMVDVEPETSGMLVADDAPALAAAIVRGCTDDALWERLSSAGRRHASARYGHSAVAEIVSSVVGSECARVVDPELTSIVILTKGARAMTEACIASIEEHTDSPFELIVVDNGSDDDTPQLLTSLAAARGNVTAVLNSANHGFAAGCNQGLALARGGTVLLLNNDTLVTPGWLSRMRDVLRHEPSVGIVGPVSNRIGGPQLVPDADYQAAGGLLPFAARHAEAFAGVVETAPKVMGFCLLARREVMETIGVLDERFGSGNFEDDDFCLRARAAGFDIRIARDAFVHHEGSATFTAERIDHERAMLRNWAVFKELWGLPVEAPLEDGYLVDPVAAGHPRYVPHRILASTHRRETGTVWVEDGLRSTLHRASSAVAASEAEALRESFVEVGGWEDVHRRYQARRRLVRAVLEDARHDPALVVVAAEGLLEALAEAPAEPLLLNELGVLLYGLGEWAAAEKIFVAVSRLDPELPGVGDNILSTREARRAGGAAVRVVRSSRSRAVASRAEGIARRARPAEGMRISLCMIVKDEEEMLPGCLGAIAPAVDEMIVVDTGSTDRTVAIAESFGAKVVSFPWNGSFADARNVSLDHATGDWILWLDADEHLVEGDAPRLRALARKTWREGIYITLNNRLGEADEEGFVHLTMRLFRNRPEYRFAGRIHEQHTDAMPLHLPERFEASDVRVDHWGYRAERVAERNKNERNRSLLEREAAESRRIDPFTDFNLGTEHLIAGEPEQAVPLLQRSWRAVVAASGPRPQYMPSLATRLLQAYRLAGEPRAALAVGEEILPIYADHTDVVRELALSARATGDLEQAAAWSERCLELGDAPARYAGAIGAGTFLALGLLASVRAEQGKLDEAEQLLERSLREHPGYRQAERALADVRGLRGAERLYERAVQGDGAGLRSSLAEAVLPAAEQSAYSAWLDVLEGRPAELPVESTPAVAALLDRLLREQRFDAFESLAAVWSSSHLPERERRGFLADLYLAHGFLDSALEEWLALADDEAGDPRALLGLARIALARGLRGDAEALASEALRLDPTLAAARELMAAALEQEESVAHAG